MKHDIGTPDDVKMMVDKFYEKVNTDKLLSPVFNHQAKIDWQSHLPKMYKFWGTQLIGTSDYSGRPFPPHTKFQISSFHFDRWLLLFNETVNENFQGPVADIAKYKAANIAIIFEHKLKSLTLLQE